MACLNLTFFTYMYPYGLLKCPLQPVTNMVVKKKKYEHFCSMGSPMGQQSYNFIQAICVPGTGFSPPDIQYPSIFDGICEAINTNKQKIVNHKIFL